MLRFFQSQVQLKVKPLSGVCNGSGSPIFRCRWNVRASNLIKSRGFSDAAGVVTHKPMPIPNAGPAINKAPASPRFALNRLFLWDSIWFRRFFRLLRMSILLGSFGATCFALGQIEYIDDPSGFERKAFFTLLRQQNVLHSVSLTEHDRSVSSTRRHGKLYAVHSYSGELHEVPHDHDLYLTAQVSQKVFKRIKQALLLEMDEVIKKLEDELGLDLSNVDEGDLDYKATMGSRFLASVPFWPFTNWSKQRQEQEKAKAIEMNHMEHEERFLLQTSTSDAQNAALREINRKFGMVKEELTHFLLKRKAIREEWTLVVLDDDVPNAFINGFLPKRLFVTTGLLREFTKNEDQLGFIIAHEMSHFLLGHSKDILMVEAAVKVVVMSLVSIIDITGGLGSFVYELLVPILGAAVGRRYSRDQEILADQFGLKIATRACYKPEKSIQLFHNMQVYTDNLENSSLAMKLNKKLDLQMLSSHPVTEDRFQTALEQLGERKKEYEILGCDDGMMTKFYKYVIDLTKPMVYGTKKGDTEATPQEVNTQTTTPELRSPKVTTEGKPAVVE